MISFTYRIHALSPAYRGVKSVDSCQSKRASFVIVSIELIIKILIFSKSKEDSLPIHYSPAVKITCVAFGRRRFCPTTVSPIVYRTSRASRSISQWTNQAAKSENFLIKFKKWATISLGKHRKLQLFSQWIWHRPNPS